ncbi:hypothetical protein N7495_004112 [Penicillium taxi]|uniref:uncharacterized protein n=1 Tax=Penicillium taxi TaxID=168475 RepID=UPI002545934D|nr:uncharacterized protein N7495_004112 [Penicillium taxi]KAJ5899368.1 hypothetical protein N7495_004112 [Penicillium taxi]
MPGVRKFHSFYLCLRGTPLDAIDNRLTPHEAPDAFKQVKKGLKALFHRRSSSKKPKPEESQSKPEEPQPKPEPQVVAEPGNAPVKAETHGNDADSAIVVKDTPNEPKHTDVPPVVQQTSAGKFSHAM